MPICIELLLDRAAKTENIPAVIRDLEGSQAVACICQLPAERSVPGQKLRVERVGIRCEDVRIPGSPFVTNRIRLRMDIGRNVLKHDHYLVSSNHRPEIIALPVPSFVAHLEAEPGLVKLNRCRQVVSDEEGCNAAQHAFRPPYVLQHLIALDRAGASVRFCRPPYAYPAAREARQENALAPAA